MIVRAIAEPLVERGRGEVVVAVVDRRLPERLERLLAHLGEPLRLGLDLDPCDEVVGLKEVVLDERVHRPHIGVLAGIELEAMLRMTVVLPVDLRMLPFASLRPLRIALLALEQPIHVGFHRPPGVLGRLIGCVRRWPVDAQRELDLLAVKHETIALIDPRRERHVEHRGALVAVVRVCLEPRRLTLLVELRLLHQAVQQRRTQLAVRDVLGRLAASAKHRQHPVALPFGEPVEPVQCLEQQPAHHHRRTGLAPRQMLLEPGLDVGDFIGREVAEGLVAGGDVELQAVVLVDGLVEPPVIVGLAEQLLAGVAAQAEQGRAGAECRLEVGTEDPLSLVRNHCQVRETLQCGNELLLGRLRERERLAFLDLHAGHGDHDLETAARGLAHGRRCARWKADRVEHRGAEVNEHDRRITAVDPELAGRLGDALR